MSYDYINSTLRGRGYISHFPLRSESKPVDIAELTISDVSKSASYQSRFVFSSLTIMCVIAVMYFLVPLLQSGNLKTPLLAVLPFKTMGELSEKSIADSAFLAQGIRADLSNRLSKLKGLGGISRTSTAEYIDTTQDYQKIGEELNADYLVVSNTQVIDDNIRIIVSLIETKKSEQLWGHTYTRELSLDSLFDIQTDVSEVISEAIHLNISSAERSALYLSPTQNIAAYHAAMQTKYDYTRLYLNNPDFYAALEKAIELDPNFAEASYQLVVALSNKDFSGLNADSVPRAEQALEHLAFSLGCT